MTWTVIWLHLHSDLDVRIHTHSHVQFLRSSLCTVLGDLDGKSDTLISMSDDIRILGGSLLVSQE
jgi:hypothetical protein